MANSSKNLKIFLFFNGLGWGQTPPERVGVPVPPVVYRCYLRLGDLSGGDPRHHGCRPHHGAEALQAGETDTHVVERYSRWVARGQKSEGCGYQLPGYRSRTTGLKRE
ncbi:MAG: hypothetical protein ACLGJC_07695 [Alphaproteobacteria bacterium]